MRPKKTKSESLFKCVFYLGTNLLTPMEYSRDANSKIFIFIHVFYGFLALNFSIHLLYSYINKCRVLELILEEIV